MAINLNSLRFFTAVAEHRGFTAAGRHLRVSQPAISKAVRQLEGQLGTQLLVRTARGVTLTEEGTVLLAHAQVLFGEERAAEEALAERRGLSRGSLRLGSSMTVASNFLPPVLGAFHTRHPAIELTLVAANTRAVLEALLANTVELGVVEGPVSHPRVEVSPWLEDELVAVAAPGHPLAQVRRLSAARLFQELFLIREEGAGTRDVVLAALRNRQVTPARLFEISENEVIKQLAAAGVGFTILSRLAVQKEIARGELATLSVDDLVLRRTLTWLQVKGRRPTAAMTEFRSLATGPFRPSLESLPQKSVLRTPAPRRPKTS
ncbi:MAG: LysR substrate-binding domain-containing protein [Myxococcaceae bacterium]